MYTVTVISLEPDGTRDVYTRDTLKDAKALFDTMKEAAEETGVSVTLTLAGMKQGVIDIY